MIQFTRPPRVVQRTVFGLLAPLARLLGYRGSYPEYSTRRPSDVVAIEPLNGVADRGPPVKVSRADLPWLHRVDGRS